MTREMVINALVPENVRVAFLADGRLENFFEQNQDQDRTRGNLYAGRVKSVQAGLEACFVDCGADRHGFLPMDEIVPAFWSRKPKDKQGQRIERTVKPGSMMLVQVDKEPVAQKGARLTTDVSLAGRYLVLMPYSDKLGVSRKIDDPELRKKSRELVEGLDPPKGMGFILRTAASGQTKRDLARDMNYLVRLWKDVQSRFRKVSQPGLIHSEVNLVKRVLRDYYTNDIDRVWIDNAAFMDKARSFFRLFMPRQKKKLKFYSDRKPIFSSFGIEEQIETIHGRRVDLPSGGSLVIDPTEALVAIDVNSGKTRGHHGQEELAYHTNLEAAEEIARQLRLRNLGGIVVIDFIDMSKSSHKTAVERCLRQHMRNDKARHRIGKISAFGLGTLTRQRLDQTIRATEYEECPTCKGDGVVLSPEPMAVRLLRSIRSRVVDGTVESVDVLLPPKLANHVQNRHRSAILALEREFAVKVRVLAAAELGPNEERLEFHPRQEEVDQEKRAAQAPAEQTAPEAIEQEPQREVKKRRRRRRKKKTKSAAVAGGQKEQNTSDGNQ